MSLGDERAAADAAHGFAGRPEAVEAFAGRPEAVEGFAGRPEAVEGFAVETRRGLLFTVKGVVHPPDRWTAYLRYVPDDDGERRRDGRRYRKLRTFAEQLEALGPRRDTYVRFDRVAGALLQGVPVEDAAHVFDPRRRLTELTAAGPGDALEAAALRLAALLAEAAGVPPAALGVTGSLLVGLQAAGSDVDLVVYGREAGRAVHAALGALLDEPASPLLRPAGEHLAGIHDAHLLETPLPAADFARLQAAKVNEGRFSGRDFFVRFVPRPDEVAERYGDFTCRAVATVTLDARVTADDEAIFTPCRYAVEDARLAGEPEAIAAAPEVREIVSFRGRFADQAREGERVHARGTLERVLPRAGAPYARLVVGAAGDYLLSLPG